VIRSITFCCGFVLAANLAGAASAPTATPDEKEQAQRETQKWERYLPMRLKKPVPTIALPNNPLQPTVTPTSHALPIARDDLTPRIASILTGKIRSVIRGATPMIAFDGRMFRVGDELVIGPNREKPLAEASVFLSGIGADKLELSVVGNNNQGRRDVTYPLEGFLRGR
jgi:hypothetical protein